MKPAARALIKVNGNEQNDSPAFGKLSQHFGLPLGQEWKHVMIVDRFTTLTRQEAGRSPTI